LEDEREGAVAPPPEQPRKLLVELASDELRRLAAQLFDRAVEELEPLRLIRPDERPQELDPIRVGGVDRVAIEADARKDDERPREELRGDRSPFLANEPNMGIRRPDDTCLVLAAVPVRDQVEAGARPQLDQIDRL